MLQHRCQLDLCQSHREELVEAAERGGCHEMRVLRRERFEMVDVQVDFIDNVLEGDIFVRHRSAPVDAGADALDERGVEVVCALRPPNRQRRIIHLRALHLSRRSLTRPPTGQLRRTQELGLGRAVINREASRAGSRVRHGFDALFLF